MFLIIGVGVAATACNLGNDLTLEVYELQVVPSPAQAGDEVSLTFELIAISSGSITLLVLIDNDEYTSQTIPGAFAGPFEWILGDAAELIDRYGAGIHSAAISVVDIGTGTSVSTNPVSFELVAAAGN